MANYESYKSEHSRVWYADMRKKFNTDDEGVSKIMAERQKQSMASPKRKEHGHIAGFSNPEVASKAGIKGMKSRYGKTDNV